MIIRKKIILIVVLLGGLLALSIFLIYDAQQRRANEAVPDISTVQTGNIRENVKAVGTIHASALVSVGAQVSGQILKLHVHLGQSVKQGQLLVEINSKTQIDKLNIAQAELKSAQADLAAKTMSVLTAEKNFMRKRELYQAGAESKELLEEAENRFKQNKMAMEMTQLRIKQLKINVNTAETELGYTQIRSPMAGTIVSLPVKVGQIINFSQSTPLLAVIANLKQMEVRMQIAEGDYTKLKLNMPVIFSTLANPKLKLNGKITSIDPALTMLSKGIYDDKTENTDIAVYYYARMMVENPDNRLSIGMTTQNEIIIAQKKNILVIPKTAIFQDDNDTLVSIYGQDKKISLRKIKTGIADLNNIEVVHGLQAGEKILSEFQQPTGSKGLGVDP